MVESPAHIRIYTFGTLSVERKRDDGTWEAMASSAWGTATYGSHTKSLLSYLLCCSQRQAFRASITDELWGSDLVSVDDYMQRATSRLRQILGSEPYFKLTVNRTKYTLADQSLLWVDVDHCKMVLEEAKRIGVTTPQGLALLQDAEYYFRRGRFLEEETGIWIHSRRSNIHTLSADCFHWLLDAYEAQGQYKQLEDLAEYLLREEPINEYALCHLMTTLHKRGMTSEAFRRYREIATLAKKTGIVLSVEAQTLASKLQSEPPSQPLSQNIIRPLNEGERNKSEYVTPWLASANVGTTTITPTFTNNHNNLDHLTYDPVQLFCIDEATPEALENFAAITETCRHLSEGNELKTAERILWAYLPRVESIAKVSFSDQKGAADITSQGYLLAASLVGHHNNLQARQYFSEQALLYGKIAQNRNLQITALRQLAVTFDYMESPHLVLQISQQAFPYLDEVSPLLRACIYAGVSGAYAQLHQKQEALHFINLAYECFPAKPEEEPHFLRTICRYSTLVFFDGLNYLDLNEPKEAEKVLARIDGLQPKIQIPERVRIELLNYQIEVFITLRAMDQACSYLEAAVKSALRIGSERRFQESQKLFQQMQAIWSKEHRVQQLEGLFAR